MVVCVVPGCGINQGNNHNKYSFHRPPSDRSLLKKWLHMLNYPEWAKEKQYRICGKHFEERCFIRKGNKKLNVLRQDAVPTLFMPVKLSPKVRIVKASNLKLKPNQNSSTENSSTSQDSKKVITVKTELETESDSSDCSSMDTDFPEAPRARKLNKTIKKLRARLERKNTLLRALRQHKKRNLKRIEALLNASTESQPPEKICIAKRAVKTMISELSITPTEVLSIKPLADGNIVVPKVVPLPDDEEAKIDLSGDSSVVYIKDGQISEIECCRVCLATEWELVSMATQNLEASYRTVTGLPLVAEDGLPQTLCSKCVALLDTCLKFRADSQRGYQCLVDLHEKNKASAAYEALTTDAPADILPESFSPEYLDDQLNEDDHYEANNIKTEFSNPSDKTEQKYMEIKYENNEGQPKIVITTLKKAKGEPLTVKPLIVDHDYIKQEKCPSVKKMETRKRAKYKPVKGEHPKRALKTLSHREYDSYIKDYFVVTRLNFEEQKEAWFKRSLTSNYLDSPFKCDYCFRGFLVEETFKAHMVGHTERNGPVVCPICKKRFATKIKLLHHNKTHNEHYDCKVCDFSCGSRHLAKEHTNWHKGVVYECDQCGMSFSKKTSRMTHIRLKHPSDYVCNLCGYSFIGPKGLHFHRIIRHKDDDRQPTEESPCCAECDIVFVSEEALQTHLSVSLRHTDHVESANPNNQSGTEDNGQAAAAPASRKENRLMYKRLFRKKNRIRSIKCEECGLPLPTLSAHRTHYRNKHPNVLRPIPGPEALCEICGKAFTNPASLQYHKATHFNEATLKCTTCNEMFDSKEAITRHRRCHTDLYLCHICGKEYRARSSRDRHVTDVHKVAIDVKCYFCEKTFKSYGLMEAHATDEHPNRPLPKKPDRRRRTAAAELERYFCDICKREFKQRRNRDRHEKDVHKEVNDVPCTICDKYFKSVASMKLHTTHVHHKKPWPNRNAVTKRAKYDPQYVDAVTKRRKTSETVERLENEWEQHMEASVAVENLNTCG